VALQPTLPVREWSPEQRQAVERKAVEMLDGVGDTTQAHWQQGSLALHLRRPMTMAEALQLPPPVRTSPDYNRRVQALRLALVAQGVLSDADVVEIHPGEE
jgi:hypothetical protein